MKKLLFLLFIILWFFWGLGFGKKAAVLPELVKPKFIGADGNKLYIAENTSVFMYSLENFKLERKFGREGEGPEEFKEKIYLIDIQKDYLVINSVGKLSYFSKEGKFIKELKTPPHHRRFRVLENKFIGAGIAVDAGTLYNTINIYDADLSKEKEIIRLELEVQPGKGTRVFARSLSYDILGNRLALSVSEDFEIGLFDQNGQKCSSITREYKRIDVTDQDKGKVIDYLKTDPETKQFFEMLKPIKFPDQYPAIREVTADTKNIYAVTWKKEGENYEVYVFRMPEKFLKKIYLPLKNRTAVDLYPFTVRDNRFYQLVENPDQEEWELHIYEAN